MPDQDAPVAAETPSPEAASGTQQAPGPAPAPRGLRARARVLIARIRALVVAIQNDDDIGIEDAVLRLSQQRRILAPLALAVGGFALLFNGVKLLVSNWRLTLVQVLPAMWIWLAMFDLKVHVLHGRQFNVVRGPILIPVCLLIIAITVAAFFLNAVFAFAIAEPGRPEIRPGVARARRHISRSPARASSSEPCWPSRP
jgi:hypothetical protein